MREMLEQIAGGFQAARAAPLRDHPLARFIRQDAKAALVEALGPLADGLTVTGSPGQGNWAEIPWIAVFDPVVTESATRRHYHYIVYLFSSDMRRVYLSLNQGTTIVRNEFGGDTRDELVRRAAIMRSRIPEAMGQFTSEPIDLAAIGTLARDYEAGHALIVAIPRPPRSLNSSQSRCEHHLLFLAIIPLPSFALENN